MTSEIAVPPAPPRGTRPRNRRELILDAAGRLFAAKGYAEVSMSDVANAVNVAPSAIYRHFPGKSALLSDAVAVGMQSFEATVMEARGDDLDELLGHLAEAALDRPHLGLLWQRESRSIPEADRAKLREHVRSTMQRPAAMVRVYRPDLTPRHADLVAASVISMLGSIAFHRIELPRARYRALLVDMARRIITFDPHDVAAQGKAFREPQVDRTRREQLLDAAVGLFAARGFNAVSIDDIGAVVGIAGPSVYHHFESKRELLLEAMDRGNARLTARVEQALLDVDSDRPPLRRLSDAYVDMALDHSDMISLLITEPGHIHALDRDRSRRIQRAFIDLWVELARTSEPTEMREATQTRVQAAQMMANDLGRTHHLHGIPGFRALVKELCWTVQHSPTTSGDDVRDPV